MAINFNAQFIVNEKTATRVLKLTDTSTGFTLAKGNFSVTFPDGSQVLHTDFTSPDISAPGGFVNIALITDIDNTVLTGTYVINFVAINAGLTEFTLQQTFDFNWEKPTKAITNESDVVLPDVKFLDSTAYETSGSFSGVLTRNFFTTTPSTSEVGVITKTSAGDVLTPSNASKYYEGIYLVRSDISVAYTHTSLSWLTVLYVDLLQETYDIREAPTQDELVGLMNTYKDQIEAYKTTNPDEYARRNEEYDLVIALYSHIIARFQTGTLDGCKPILDQLLGLLPPTNPYTYKATQMLPFTINFTTSLTGTGTVGTIAKFTAGAAVGDSIIKEDTGRIGIGKVPTVTLDVNGAIQGTSIVKAGGTSSQFLKADGSVDASTYLTGITSGQVTGALGFTPYNATNPNAYIALTALSAGAGISYSNTTGVIASTITQYTDALARASISLTTTGTSGSATYNSTTGVLNIPSYIGGVTSFNTRTGAITLTSSDVTTALTFTPYNATNPSAFIALTALSAGTGISYNNTTGVITNTITQYTDALARASVSLTTTGTSGAATYDNTTGVFNIPQYQSVLTNPITGTGTVNYVPKFNTTSSIANSNIQDNGSLITIGSNTYVNGSLGIGTSSLTGYGIRNNKNVTGAATAYGMQFDGTIQSDVTGNVYVYRSNPFTQAATFTLGNLSHFNANQGTFGAGSTVTNQTGFVASATLIGATNNYGFRGQIPSGTNTWNLYMDGTASNYLAGSLGIGTTTLTGYNLRVNKNITGAIISHGILSEGAVQSDVTDSAYYNRTVGSTVAASFTMLTLHHYNASQGTFGAGSTVNNQYGFRANSSLIGATFNYGFFGDIPSGTNRYNLFMNGTADNYLAGDTSIGTATLGTATKLTVGGSETAVSAIARGQLISPTLVASANSDVLVGLDINPTFTNGAFTGVTNMALRFSGTGNNVINSLGDLFIQRGGLSGLQILSTNTHLRSTVNTSYVSIGLTTTEYFRVMANTGNVSIQNGGTFTDAGFRLDVNGTARVQGELTVNTVNIGLGGGAISNNTRVGLNALNGNTTGSNNVAFGQNALQFNTTGSLNTAIGTNSAINNSTGSSNTLIGVSSLQNNLTGSLNVAIGRNSGRFIADGTTTLTIANNSIFLGFDTRANADNQTNQIVIGHQAIGLGSNTTVLGNTSTTLTALYGAVITGGTSVNASAQFQVDSTTKGFLPPRMTATQRAAIATPPEGLVVFQTDGTVGLYLYASAAWHGMTML
jgi:hypothetical protein